MNTSINRWTEPKCAKAFWSQQDLPPYKELLQDTIAWLQPRDGERWLDLGCGGGALSRAVWEKSSGQVAEVIGVDIAAANRQAYDQLSRTLSPPPGDRVRFIPHDFSTGLSLFRPDNFQGIVSGLSMSYAESFDPDGGKWTSRGYDSLLSELFRVLSPGGQLVFSVNVPDPSWSRIAWQSLGVIRRSRKPLRFAKKAWRMLRYGAWLKREASAGRFHYFSSATITEKLSATGFDGIEHRMSYSDQAYIFRCVKPEGAASS